MSGLLERLEWGTRALMLALYARVGWEIAGSMTGLVAAAWEGQCR